MESQKSWLRVTKTAIEITLKRKDFEHKVTPADILHGLPSDCGEKHVFEVAFILCDMNDSLLIWVCDILRICQKYIDSLWIMLSQPPYSLLLDRNGHININPLNNNLKQIDSNILIELFSILNESSIKYRLCLQAMDFSRFNLNSYHHINKCILKLLSINNRNKSIFFVPVLSKNWITFYKENKNEFNNLLTKISSCAMINSFGIWMRNEFINKNDINKYIIPIIKSMTLNENVAFLMFRFDLMLMDTYNSNDNNKLFDEIEQCLINKKITNNIIKPYWKSASRIPKYLSNSYMDAAISLSFRVDKYFHRDFLYGDDTKLCKLLIAINKNNKICLNRMALSRGDIIINKQCFKCIADIINNHKIHSLEQIIIDGYIHDNNELFNQFIDSLIHPKSQMKNISLHTIKHIDKCGIPDSIIKLIKYSNKMMNYIGISIDGFDDDIAYNIIDAYLFRMINMYKSQLAIKKYLKIYFSHLPYDITHELITFCQMDCYVVSIQIKEEIIKKFQFNFKMYRQYFIQKFNQLFNQNQTQIEYKNVFSMISKQEVALYIGTKVNMHEFTQDDLWKISP